MSTRSTATTLATPDVDEQGAETTSRGVTVDTEPERKGYLAARWLRPGDLHAGDWMADADMTRARLTRRHRRFLGQVAPTAGRPE